MRVTSTSASRRVWALTGLLAAAGAVLTSLAVVDATGPAAARFGVSWGVLVALFALAEVLVVHVVFRREGYTLSLSEVPLVLGLWCASGPSLVSAHVLGAGLAFVVHRRQRGLKLCFNLANTFLHSAAALAVFHAVGVGGGPATLHGTAASALAVLVTVPISAAAVSAAIALHDGRGSGRKLLATAAANGVATLTNASVGLLAVVLVTTEVAGAWLLMVPAAVLLACYRGLTLSRRKQESLQFLYEASRILHHGASKEGPMTELLELTRRMFGAAVAELTLFADGERGLRTTVGPGPDATPFEPVDLAADPSPEERGLPVPAVVAHLEGETRRLGTMLVAGPCAVRRTFTRRDLQLFETLANQVSVALENGMLETSLAELTALKDELRHRAYHDELTGLGNRALFLAELRVATEETDAREGVTPAVLFVDLDDFKAVNDTLGHAAGDELLVEVARRLRASLRPHDVAARLGGDEFAVLLQGLDAEDEAVTVAERILAALRPPVQIGGDPLHVTASVGVAVGRGSGCAADNLLRSADMAMYTAKLHGKGRWEVFEPSMQQAVTARHVVRTELQRAVEHNEFLLRYQPIVDLRSGQVVGVEALLRWCHPERGLLHPAEFVPAAEDTGLVARLGRWVLRAACEQVRAWQDEMPFASSLFLSVNVSPREFRQPAFVEGVADVLAEVGPRPGTLVLEITEGVMVDGPGRAGPVLRNLRSLGVRLAVDDFGTGYSSLGYLDEMTVDMLKIAKPFVDALARENTRPTLAQAIVQLGAGLGLEVVAEGIEGLDQLVALQAMGCPLGQGYALGVPLPPDLVRALLLQGGVPVERVAAPARA